MSKKWHQSLTLFVNILVLFGSMVLAANGKMTQETFRYIAGLTLSNILLRVRTKTKVTL